MAFNKSCIKKMAASVHKYIYILYYILPHTKTLFLWTTSTGSTARNSVVVHKHEFPVLQKLNNVNFHN